MRLLLTARFYLGSRLKKTLNGPKSTDQFTKDGKTVTYEKVRETGKHKLELFGQEWWLQGCTLSTETTTEVTLRDCRLVER